MTIEPIDDVDSTEEYITDLLAEITSLQKEVKKLNKQLQSKHIIVHKDYDKLLKNFHRLLDETIPF